MASLPPSSFKCSTCSKSFSKAVYLKKHAIVHTGDKRFKCPFCSKTCLRNGDLKKHLVTHTGERRYQCDVCAKTFTQGCHLKEHQLVHSTDKPVSCNICCKSFKDNRGLRRHILMHTGQNPFQCYACCKTFARSTDLRTHMLVVHCGEQVYCCGECSRMYAVLDALKEHMKIHTEQVSTAAADDDGDDEQMSECVLVPVSYDSASRSTDSHDDDRCLTPRSLDLESETLVTESMLPVKSAVMDPKSPGTESKSTEMESMSPGTESKSTKMESMSPVTDDLDIFMCSECLKCFSTDAVLQKHLLVHIEDDMAADSDGGQSEDMKQDGRREPYPSMWAGKRLFKCTECSECFAEDCMLRNHMWTHVKEKHLETSEKKQIKYPKTTKPKRYKRRKQKQSNATDFVPDGHKEVKHMVIHPDKNQLGRQKCSRADGGTELDELDDEDDQASSPVSCVKSRDCHMNSGSSEQHQVSQARRASGEELSKFSDNIRNVRRRKKLTPRRHIDRGEIDSDDESDICQLSNVDGKSDICQPNNINRESDIYQPHNVDRESNICTSNNGDVKTDVCQTSGIPITSESKRFTCDKCHTSFSRAKSLKQHLNSDCNINDWRHGDTDCDDFKHIGIKVPDTRKEKYHQCLMGAVNRMDFAEGEDSTDEVGSENDTVCPSSLSNEDVSPQNSLTVLKQNKSPLLKQKKSQITLHNESKVLQQNRSPVMQNKSPVLKIESPVMQNKSPILKANNLHVNQMDTVTPSEQLLHSSSDHLTFRCQRRLFECEVCAQTFIEGESLRMHRRDAHRKPFTCSVCAKTFAFSSTLKTHMVAHTDHELYRCETCAKTFTRKGNLKRHIFLHCN